MPDNLVFLTFFPKLYFAIFITCHIVWLKPEVQLEEDVFSKSAESGQSDNLSEETLSTRDLVVIHN